MADYQLLQDRVTKNLNPDVTIGQIPAFVFKLLEIPKTTTRNDWLAMIEPTLGNALMDFQKEGVCFGIAKNGRCLIADDMGLGKTYQALGIADFYKEDWPMLICTTATARDHWCQTIRALLPYVGEFTLTYCK
jgi:SWI/SNF-related matrix-associated actin-dependent regulator of chromatin subfamily A-like protein 1